MDQSSFDLTPDEAVQVLLARHAVSGRVKQAIGMPQVPDLSQHVQSVMTPPEGNNLYRAINHGLIGAGAGALGGAGSALLSGNRKNWLRRALTGALVGGGIGAAVPSAQALASEAFKDTPSMSGLRNQQATNADTVAKFKADEPFDQQDYDAAWRPPSPVAASPAASDPPGTGDGGNNDPVSSGVGAAGGSPPPGGDNSQAAWSAIRKSFKPVDSATAAVAAANQNDYGSAAQAMAPVTARAVGQGLAGLAAGTALDNRHWRRTPQNMRTPTVGKGYRLGLGAAALAEPAITALIQRLLSD